MCIICVEIMRERLAIKDAKDALKESVSAGADYDDHTAALVDALNSGDDAAVKKVAKAGEKKERWI